MLDSASATADAFYVQKDLLLFLGFALQLIVNELAGAALATLWTQFPLYTVWSLAAALIAHCGQAFGTKSYELQPTTSRLLLAYECLRQYLQPVGIVMPTTVNGIMVIGSDVSGNYLLVYTAGLDFDGLPLATIVASWCQPTALFLYAFVYKQY
ncbi:hypothetical protein ACHHYP_20736 [Achlya hypogyna]|uniref:Uncharacterized protein n=1 Tax=Achlya hypogyna TaxID=1202772 RepID=A0A1V9YCX6_ACHHY|nr:hypothetical protein ACHHYP_20736 [Achlya hypogyna]